MKGGSLGGTGLIGDCGELLIGVREVRVNWELSLILERGVKMVGVGVDGGEGHSG